VFTGLDVLVAVDDVFDPGVGVVDGVLVAAVVDGWVGCFVDSGVLPKTIDVDDVTGDCCAIAGSEVLPGVEVALGFSEGTGVALLAVSVIGLVLNESEYVFPSGLP